MQSNSTAQSLSTSSSLAAGKQQQQPATSSSISQIAMEQQKRSEWRRARMVSLDDGIPQSWSAHRGFQWNFGEYFILNDFTYNSNSKSTNNRWRKFILTFFYIFYLLHSLVYKENCRKNLRVAKSNQINRKWMITICCFKIDINFCAFFEKRLIH